MDFGRLFPLATVEKKKMIAKQLNAGTDPELSLKKMIAFFSAGRSAGKKKIANTP